MSHEINHPEWKVTFAPVEARKGYAGIEKRTFGVAAPTPESAIFLATCELCHNQGFHYDRWARETANNWYVESAVEIPGHQSNQALTTRKSWAELEGFTGSGSDIFNRTLEAMQDAEEIWGLGDDEEEYIRLMDAIRRNCETRIRTVKENMGIPKLNEGGDWGACPNCRNTPETGGFFPCDADGKTIEPYDGNYGPETLYRCDGCDRVYDNDGKYLRVAK